MLPGGEDNGLLFDTADEGEDSLRTQSSVSALNVEEQVPWKVLVVDDEEAIHSVTRLVIGGVSFLNKRIQILNAYSGEEGQKMITDHPDVALMLVDVVMETDQAGLDLIRYVRQDLKNHVVRLVLRTGQPGIAPEKDVIVQYDINGYHEKTELTAQKLYTLLYASLRSYHDISSVVSHRKGLERIITTTQQVFKIPSIDELGREVLEQVKILLNFDGQRLCVRVIKDSENILQWYWQILLSSDHFEKIPDLIQERMQHAFKEEKNIYEKQYSVLFFKVHKEEVYLFYLNFGKAAESELERYLLEIFSNNVKVAFENLRLAKEIEETQRELVYRLGEAVESRSKETGNHVRRVAHVSELLALKAGVSSREAYIIKLASPMHDLGKIAIPDAILNKPGKLDPSEWAVMKTHAEQGYEILKGSNRAVLQVAASLAREHHEKWDGSGYPRGLKAEQISLEGRITAVADVFDALSSSRVYKPGWSKIEIANYFKEQQGKQFDPRLVEILLRDYVEFDAIRALYPDSGSH